MAVNLDKLIDKYLIYCEYELRCSEKTLKNKGYLFSKFAEYFKNDFSISKARNYIKEQFDNDRSASGIATDIKQLKAFCRWLHDEKIIAEDWSGRLKTPKNPGNNSPPYIPSKTLYEWIIEGTKPTKDSHKLHIQSQNEHRDCLVFMLSTGVRVNEVVNMKASWINSAEGTYKIISKGQSVPTVMKTPDNCLKMLEERESRKGLAFDGVNKKGLSKYLKRGAKRCGNKNVVVYPHLLRHSFVSDLLINGVPVHVVQKLARHSDAQTTLKYYSHVNNDQLVEFLNSYHPLIQKEMPFDKKIEKLDDLIKKLGLLKNGTVTRDSEEYSIRFKK